jgi:diacylglycerol kinase (ATP)
MEDFEPHNYPHFCCLKTFRYAWKGVQYLFRTQPNARVQLIVFVLVVFAGFLFGISKPEWLAILIVSAVVITAEGMNTALEILGDEVADGKWKNLVGRAKDVSAGAVLIAAVFAIVVGLVIFVPYIFQLFKLL